MEFLIEELIYALISSIPLIEKVDNHHIKTLTVPVAATDSLFNPLWIPGKIIID